MSDNDQAGAISDVEDQESPDYAGKKRLIVILLLVYSVISGSLSYFIPEEDRLLDYLSILPTLFLAFYWCTTDAAERDYEIGVGTKLLLILLLGIGLPVYLLQTRGLSGFKSIGWALLLFIGMLACSFMGEFIALHAQEVADQVVWRVSNHNARLVAGTFHVPSARTILEC